MFLVTKRSRLNEIRQLTRFVASKLSQPEIVSHTVHVQAATKDAVSRQTSYKAGANVCRKGQAKKPPTIEWMDGFIVWQKIDLTLYVCLSTALIVRECSPSVRKSDLILGNGKECVDEGGVYLLQFLNVLVCMCMCVCVCVYEKLMWKLHTKRRTLPKNLFPVGLGLASVRFSRNAVKNASNPHR